LITGITGQDGACLAAQFLAVVSFEESEYTANSNTPAARTTETCPKASRRTAKSHNKACAV
jgi:GDP-D-mannose dehydratase